MNMLETHCRERMPASHHFQDEAVAYLVNKYPLVSHSFIRREIKALESLGVPIVRLSIRGWDEVLVVPDDLAERERTTFVLKAGPVRLLWASLVQAVCAPVRFASAFRLAVRMMRWSDRPALWHLIYLAEACWIVRYLRGRKIAHLHAHFGTNPADVAMLIGELSGIQYSCTVHGPEEFDRVRTTHLAEKIKRAAFVVAISSFARSQIFRILPPRQWEKVKLVYCGIDAAAFGDIDGRAPPHASRLVCVGRLCEQKGQLLLVRAVAELLKEGRKIELVLVGDGEHRPLLENFIREHGASGSIRMTGLVSDEQLKSEVLNSRAFVLPSFAEGLPMSIMEAMILGKPVLSTYVAGIPELVEPGKTGWLFPAGSMNDLKNAIRSCLDTPNEALLAMGRAARARVLEQHDVQSQAARLAELFIAQSSKRRPGNVHQMAIGQQS